MVVLSFSGLLAGCGSQKPICAKSPPVLAISPTPAAADHTAAPGNQQQFIATGSPEGVGPGCAVPATIALLTPTWTVCDMLHASISNAGGPINGVATCVGPTTGAAIVTATVGSGPSVTKLTASLTCK